MSESGEPDPGEGNGQWDKGESFDDFNGNNKWDDFVEPVERILHEQRVDPAH